MFDIITTTNFERDYKSLVKRGKDMSKLEKVIVLLSNGISLDRRYDVHQLYGDYKRCMECHIEPNWLLIYEIKEDTNALILIRSGSHSDLF